MNTLRRWTIRCLMLTAISSPNLVQATSTAAVISTQLDLKIAGASQELPDWEAEYLSLAVARLYQNCNRIEQLKQGDLPRARQNQLSVQTEDGSLRLIQALSGSDNPFSKLAIYDEKDGVTRRFGDCNMAHVLPVAGIIESRNLELSPPERRTTAGLTSYQPNTIGWTFDDNDVDEGYLDAVLSVKYPFFHDGYYSAEGSLLNPYFAFTGRFSQYIESRDSSPVIGKSFNPKFFLRHWLGDDSRYVDIGYAHESNGQNINSQEAYLRERDDFISEGQDPDFARDYISRGWDYLSLDWKHAWGRRRAGLSTYLNLKYFLDDGLFQGNPEEYNDWEGDGVNRRKEYDGIDFLARYRFGRSFCLTNIAGRASREWEPNFCLQKLAWKYTTGYSSMFDNNTNRLELTIDLWGIPMMVWGQTGYNSDLVDYYQDVESWGVALELRSF